MFSINGYTPKGIVFAPTYECEARCGHCNIPFDSIDTVARLRIETALRVLTEGKALGLHSFQIAGGEPTIHDEFMVEIIRAGRRLSMKAHRPPTNCRLGGEPERLLSFFRSLKAAGFTAGFRVSCDAFHTRVPLEWTARFISEAGNYLPLRNFIIGCCDADEERSRRRLVNLAEEIAKKGCPAIFQEDFLYVSGSKIKVSFWAPTRPTWKPLPDHVFRFRDVLTAPDARHRFDREAPITAFGCIGPRGVGFFWIDPTGDVRACCGNSNLFSDALIMGNVEKEPLSEIYKRAAESPLLSILARGGPVALAMETGTTEYLKRQYTHRCELCALLLAEPHVTERFKISRRML